MAMASVLSSSAKADSESKLPPWGNRSFYEPASEPIDVSSPSPKRCKRKEDSPAPSRPSEYGDCEDGDYEYEEGDSQLFGEDEDPDFSVDDAAAAIVEEAVDDRQTRFGRIEGLDNSNTESHRSEHDSRTHATSRQQQHQLITASRTHSTTGSALLYSADDVMQVCLYLLIGIHLPM